jgi:hypothetical protein
VVHIPHMLPIIQVGRHGRLSVTGPVTLPCSTTGRTYWGRQKQAGDKRQNPSGIPSVSTAASAAKVGRLLLVCSRVAVGPHVWKPTVQPTTTYIVWSSSCCASRCQLCTTYRLGLPGLAGASTLVSGDLGMIRRPKQECFRQPAQSAGQSCC